MIHIMEIKIRVDSVSIVREKAEETKMEIAMKWASQHFTLQQQQHISYDAKCFFFFLSIIRIFKKKQRVEKNLN